MTKQDNRTSDGFLVWIIFLGWAILFGSICAPWYVEAAPPQNVPVYVQPVGYSARLVGYYSPEKIVRLVDNMKTAPMVRGAVYVDSYYMGNVYIIIVSFKPVARNHSNRLVML